MSKKKWLILIGLGVALCVVALVSIAFLVSVFLVVGAPPINPLLPVYTIDQGASAHPGYRRTTATSGTNVYVSDFEEQMLQLQNYDPNHVIGRSLFGGGEICSIPGQPPTAYIAVDEGSEMPAFAVFRNSQRPPFDWRHATFRSMEYTAQIGPSAHKRTTDPALIEDVIHTLRDGTSVTSPPLAAISGIISNLNGVWLICDQLPGLAFNPNVYKEPSGPAYLVDSFVTLNDFTNKALQVRWIPASPLFNQWLQTP
ncbi:MAG: hypothetical protein ABSD58_07145 [Verrucomicrobiia bacterium]|jgi:hypothetical protein